MFENFLKSHTGQMWWLQHVWGLEMQFWMVDAFNSV
jgi:hypothetical protein